MKRASWLFFLCAFIVLLAPPIWAEEYNFRPDTSSDLSTVKLTLKSGDKITFAEGNYYVSGDFSLDIENVNVEVTGTNAVLWGKSNDKYINRTFPVITISGDGAKGTTITGLKFQNISMSIKNQEMGGVCIAVISADNVTISNCVFESNEIGHNIAPVKHTGGVGIFVRDAQNLKVESCDFRLNHIGYTSSGAGTNDGGGGIYTLAKSRDVSVDVISCNFLSNDRPAGVNGSGGAMSNVAKDKDRIVIVRIYKSTFTGNKAGRYGGAIFNATDTWMNDSTKGDCSVDVYIDDCTFTGNKAEGAINNGSFGGAIASYGYIGNVKLDVTNSRFYKNETSNSELYNKSRLGAGGGAICVYTNSSGDAEGSIIGCLFEENKSHWGGALVNWGHSGKSSMLVKDCTFISNEVVASYDIGDKGTTNSNSSNNLYTFHPKDGYGHYPVGAAFLCKALTDSIVSADTKGTAASTLINCTFIDNKSVYGGTVASNKSAANSATTELYNCTFVNNKITSDDYKSNGIDILAIGDNGNIKVYNSIFSNVSSDTAAMFGKYAAASKISLDHCAIPENTTVSGEVGSNDTNIVSISSLANASNPKEVMLNGVKHKIIFLTASDSEDVRTKASYDVTYSKDILGVARSTSTPSMGAVEYGAFITTSGDVLDDARTGAAYEFQLKDVPANIEFTWSVPTIEGLDELSIDESNILTATPSSADTYTFTATLTGTGDYSYYTASKDYTLKVVDIEVKVDIDESNLTDGTYAGTDYPKELKLAVTVSSDIATAGEFETMAEGTYKLALESTSTDAQLSSAGLALTSEDNVLTITATTAGVYYIPVKVTATLTSSDKATGTDTATITLTVTDAPKPKLTATSSDVTVARSADVSITITEVSADSFEWSFGGTLPTGVSYAKSDDNAKVVTISGTVAEAVELGTYTFTATATNTYGTDTATITITVEDAAPVIGSESYSFNAPKGVPVTQEVTATSGTNLTWTLEDAPSWVSIVGDGQTATISATAPTSDATGTVYNFTVAASNDKAKATADVEVTVAGSISGSDEEYTDGVYTATPASKTTGTNAAGQPTATTTTVFTNGAGETMVSIDITITGESTDLRTRIDAEYETPVSVDVKIDVRDSNYNVYAYSIDVAGAPFMSVLGETHGLSKDLVTGDVHHDFKLVGTPKVSGDFDLVVTFNAYMSGDIPVLGAVDSLDMHLSVDVALKESAADEVITSGDEIIGVVEELSEEMPLNAEAISQIVDSITKSGGDPATVTTLVLPTNLTAVTAGLEALKAAFPELTTIDISNSELKNETTIDLSDNDWLTGLTMDGQETVTEVVLTGSAVKNFSGNGSAIKTLEIAESKVETVSVNNSQVSEIEATNCPALTTLAASNCDSMTSVTATNCPELTTLAANQCDNLDTLTVESCRKLDTVSAQGKSHTRGTKAKGIRTATFDNCPNIRNLDLSSNRILRQHLEGLANLVNVDMGDQHENITTMSGRFNLARLFFGDILSSAVEDADEDEIKLTEDQAEELARVTAVTGIDAVGRHIDANYNAATGEIVFASAPTSFKYAYDTKATISGGTLDAEIEPDAFEEADPTTPGEGSGSGGGCDAGFGLFAAAIALATLLMKKH